MAGRIVFFVASLFIAAALFLFAVLLDARAESSPAVADGAHGGGNPRFFFLPPLAPEPETGWAFDAYASPIVEVCLLADGECAGEPVEMLSVGDGLRVDERREHYVGFVMPRRGEFERGEAYRFRVVANGAGLGHVDATVVRGAKEARGVYGSGGVPMLERAPFPIRFRIEEGLVTSVRVEPETVSMGEGESAQLSATVFDVRGEEFSGREVAWQSDAPDVAGVDENGAVTGISEGSAEITASVDGVSDMASVAVAAPPPPEGTYYVSNDGSDGNTGLSPDDAWRTVAKVNGVVFDPGDEVLFERGGEWHEMLQPRASGTAEEPIVFGGYGDGRPILDGAGATGFTGINAGKISHVVFEGFEVRNRSNDMLVYLAGAENVAFDGLYLHDAKTGVHATGTDPSTGIVIQNSKIEDTIARDANGNAIGGIGMNVNDGSSGWKVSDTEVAGAGDSCIIDRGSNNTYERMNVHRCGYSTITFGAHGLYLKGSGHKLLDSEVWDIFEYGNANSCVSVRYEDARVQGNRIHGCYGGLGIFDETDVSGVVTVRRNEFWDNFVSIYGDGSADQALHASNNTILGTRTGARAIYLNAFRETHVENNIVTGQIDIPLFIREGAVYVERANVFHSTQAPRFFWWEAGAIRITGFEAYATGTGQGEGSTTTDPLLASNDPANPDFSIRSDSRIIDTGTANPASGTLSGACDGGPDSYCGSAPEPGAREYNPQR